MSLQKRITKFWRKPKTNFFNCTSPLTPFNYNAMPIGAPDPYHWVCLAYTQLPKEGGVNAGKRMTYLVAPEFYVTSLQDVFTHSFLAVKIPYIRDFCCHGGSQGNHRFHTVAQFETAALKGEIDDGAFPILGELANGENADKSKANVTGCLLELRRNSHLSRLFDSSNRILVTNMLSPEDPRIVRHVSLDGFRIWGHGNFFASRGCLIRAVVG